MLRKLGIALAVTLAGIGITAPAAAASVRIPPCATEDGGPLPCLWNATTRGNRLGNSFVMLPNGTTLRIYETCSGPANETAWWDGSHTTTIRWSWSCV